MMSWSRTTCTVCRSSKNTLTGLISSQTRNIIYDVDDTVVLKMSIPSEDILSGKAAIVKSSQISFIAWKIRKNWGGLS